MAKQTPLKSRINIKRKNKTPAIEGAYGGRTYEVGLRGRKVTYKKTSRDAKRTTTVTGDPYTQPKKRRPRPKGKITYRTGGGF